MYESCRLSCSANCILKSKDFHAFSNREMSESEGCYFKIMTEITPFAISAVVR